MALHTTHISICTHARSDSRRLYTHFPIDTHNTEKQTHTHISTYTCTCSRVHTHSHRVYTHIFTWIHNAHIHRKINTLTLYTQLHNQTHTQTTDGYFQMHSTSNAVNILCFLNWFYRSQKYNWTRGVTSIEIQQQLRTAFRQESYQKVHNIIYLSEAKWGKMASKLGLKRVQMRFQEQILLLEILQQVERLEAPCS